MKKKIAILVLSVLLVVFIIILILTNKKEEKYENIYECEHKEEIADVTISTKYRLYYDNDNVLKVDFNRSYKGTTEKAINNIYSYRYIINEESKLYEEYKGFSHKVNKDTKKEYNYTYKFDVSKLEQDFLTMFNVYNSLEEQKTYFSENEYNCK